MTITDSTRLVPTRLHGLQVTLEGAAYVLLASVGLLAPALAGSSDNYRYSPVGSPTSKVCRHMQAVFNEHFMTPWKRPALAVGNHMAYGPNGSYSFAKLPGVGHDNRASFQMSYSKFPSSHEFDDIKWREGRYRFVSSSGIDHGDQPYLVAEIDIDNDGQRETVVKSSFMLNYWPSHESVAGGEDTLFVFRRGTVDLNLKLEAEAFYNGQDGKQKPAMIQGVRSSRSLRPFILDGVVYLAAYEQKWKGGEFMDSRTKLEGEFMNVLRYRGGGENLGQGKWSPVQMDLVCQYRMQVDVQR